MKQVFLRITILWALAFIAATQAVRAQEPLLANIPFAFTAGNRSERGGVCAFDRGAREWASDSVQVGLPSPWQSLFSFQGLDCRLFARKRTPANEAREGASASE